MIGSYCTLNYTDKTLL